MNKPTGKNDITIIRFLKRVRSLLNYLREKNPQVFDNLTKLIEIAIPFVSAFAPAFFSCSWMLMICNLFLFLSILMLQWATLTNRRIREIDEIKSNYNKNIKEIESFYNMFSYKIAHFSHMVSHKVKEINADIATHNDGRTASDICNFLQESVNSLEDIMTEYYKREVRASIKITIGNDAIKTYVRGSKNITSRGGELKVYKLNEVKINIKENYAYEAIVNSFVSFFSEGNLMNIQNKVKTTDSFYCEYNSFEDVFLSTIIMPIRTPTHNPDGNKMVVHGMICLDCKEEFPEWSRKDLKETIGYHIIADYADSLAVLMKSYSHASW